METTETTIPDHIEATEVAERFTITDEKGAVWLLRKLRLITEDKDAVKAATAQRLAELDADEKHLKHLYGEQLRAWALAESEKRRRQTITLPLAGMQVAFRKTATALVLEDQSSALAEATKRGLVKTSPDLVGYRAEAEAWFEKTGEMLPGFDHKPEGTSFTWKLIKQGKGTESTPESEYPPPRLRCAAHLGHRQIFSPA